MSGTCRALNNALKKDYILWDEHYFITLLLAAQTECQFVCQL